MRNIMIRIDRPLIFLCGPYPSDLDKPIDRRELTYERIIKYRSNSEEYRPMPFIVDYLFNKDENDTRGLSLSLIEEIVANIAFRTYIFLDTQSTAMELGLFINNNQNNQIRVLLPKNSSISSFIDQSIQTRGKIIDTWEYNSNKNEKGHIFFVDNELDKELGAKITSDLDSLLNVSADTEIKFINSRTNSDDYTKIHYYIDDKDGIIFNINTKLLFYTLLNSEELWPLTKYDKNIDSFHVKAVIKDLKKNIFEYFTTNSLENNHIKAKMIIKKNFDNVEILNNLGTNLYETVRHLLNIIQIMMISNRTSPNQIQTLISRRRAIYYSHYFKFTPGFEDLFNLTRKDFCTIRSYISNPQKYIRSFTITMHGKKKTIHTYSSNKYGSNLRNFHKKINQILALFPVCNSSTAYTKGRSIKDSLIKHVDSMNFLKMDVSKFFDSIRYGKLINVIKSITDKHTNDCFYNIFRIGASSDTRYRSKSFTSEFNDRYLDIILESCFFQRKLPIGFITSPTLSNIYMYKFDLEIEMSCDERHIIYTRYADDLLFSSSIEQESLILYEIHSVANKLLEKMYLKENKSKHKMRTFKNVGDSIKYLGVNIVRGRTGNHLTISNNYLRDTIKMEIFKTQNKEIILGRKNFIKFISLDSYDNYIKMMKIRRYNAKLRYDK